jgi:hypothetical protein
MNVPRFPADEGSLFHYKVRVRPPTPPAVQPTQCLWGSSGVSPQTFLKPLILHIHNDLFGEPVQFGTQVITGTSASPGPPDQTLIGTLQPGECISIPLQGYSGVYATCAVETTVYCSIKASE